MSLAESFDFLGRRSQSAAVATGDVYRRRAAGNVVETARVLSVRPDDQGIAHVRYQVSIQQGPETRACDERLLNLQSFVERYRERVEA